MNDRIKLTTGGGGCLSLFGLPFLLAGLFVLIAPEFGVVIHSEGGGEASPAARWVLGLVFSTIGSALVFGRSGLVIDRLRDEVTLWWGVLIPFSRKTSRPDDYELVALHREVRTSRSSNGGSRSYTVFPVRLRAKAGDDVELMSFRDRQKARAFGERVAKTLETGLADATEGVERIRAAGTLDDSLRMQLRDTPPPVPKQPALGDITYATEGRVAVLELPAPGFLRSGGLQASFGLLALPMLGVFALATGAAAGSAALLFVGFAVIVALSTTVPVLLALLRGKTAERLRISADAVTIERKGPLVLGARTKTIAMDDLEEVELRGTPSGRSALFGLGKRVALQADHGSELVGGGLEGPQQEWLRDLIRYVAVHQRAPEPSPKG